MLNPNPYDCFDWKTMREDYEAGRPSRGARQLYIPIEQRLAA